jgi:hypothetical protein
MNTDCEGLQREDHCIPNRIGSCFCGGQLVVFVILLLGIPAYWVWKPFALEKLLLQKN